MEFSSVWLNKKKINLEKHTEIFLEFFGLLEQANKREKQKREKLFTLESSQQAKEEREIFLGFLLITTTTCMESKLANSYNNFFGFS